MTVMFTEMPREDVITYLGRAWPAPPGATVERVRFLSEHAHGGVSVQSGSQPGMTWWVVDGLIVPQDAGPVPRLEGDEVYDLPPDDSPTEPPLDLAAAPLSAEDTTP
ncbi:hypothetical protein ELQ39_15955 [Streptomyces sp. GB4-14]|uniref:hypothetical protein n=1 Tax=Streptomyces sp. GB4-14 TaxID=2498703 RepID=UPI001F5F5F4A|nr:hypothetical protein [Streptomyces sp. GB4-14]